MANHSSFNYQTQAERARAYAQKFPPAISGQGGHNSAFKLANKLTRGFELTPDVAFPIFAEWNRRCLPPFTEAELRHKLRDADTKGTEPRGDMFRNNRQLQFKSCPLEHESGTPKRQPDRKGFLAGNEEQIRALAQMRPYHREGLELAQKRGLLVFGKCCGFECYAVTDKVGCVLEARRVDGKTFPPTENLAERKSHALKGSCKAWPVGVLEAADKPAIALVEGIPDFLAAHYELLWEGKENYCAVVAMLSASPAISPDALPHFKEKHVRLFPHVDKAGIEAAAKWKAQLTTAGTAKVDLFDFSRYQGVKDFYEALHAPAQLPARMLP